MTKKPPDMNKVVATNRQARRDYEILDEWECGIMLQGSEVKSLREAKVTLSDAFGRFVAAIPAPLGIGTIRLADGSTPKGFLVEAEATLSSRDVSSYGSWRAFVSAGGYHHHIGANSWQSAGAGPRAMDRTGLSFVELTSKTATGTDEKSDPWGNTIRTLAA